MVTPLISNVFQQIPGLVTLKRFSCVSFAGVDSLNDVKNRTYHDLFVSGGFVVSDESVLNPESITTGRCGLVEALELKSDISVCERSHTHHNKGSGLPIFVMFFENFSCFSLSAQWCSCRAHEQGDSDFHLCYIV